MRSHRDTPPRDEAIGGGGEGPHMNNISDATDTLKNILKTASFLGKNVAVSQVQSMLMPQILKVFSEHGHEDLQRMIVTNYSLVEEQTPPGIRNALDNLGSNPETRQQWEGVVLEYITPENIIEWLRNPEEWLNEEEAEKQREELKLCATTIEETEGGEEWLETQVMDLYRMAHIVPNNSKSVEAND